MDAICVFSEKFKKQKQNEIKQTYFPFQEIYTNKHTHAHTTVHIIGNMMTFSGIWYVIPHSTLYIRCTYTRKSTLSLINIPALSTFSFEVLR